MAEPTMQLGSASTSIALPACLLPSFESRLPHAQRFTYQIAILPLACLPPLGPLISPTVGLCLLETVTVTSTMSRCFRLPHPCLPEFLGETARSFDINIFGTVLPLEDRSQPPQPLHLDHLKGTRLVRSQGGGAYRAVAIFVRGLARQRDRVSGGNQGKDGQKQ